MFDFLRHKLSIESSSLLKGGEDAHTHILYGVDDGISSIGASLAALQYEESLGVTSVCCTPHIMEDVPNTTDVLRRRFDELSAAYDGPLRLHLAAEYMIDNLFVQRFKTRDLLPWGNGMILMETSAVMPPMNLRTMFSEVMMAGYTPLFAHPERYRYLKDEDYIRFFEDGVRFQLNLPSLVGRYGRTVRERALWLLGKGYYSAFGSDCHRVNAVKEQYAAKELSVRTVRMLESAGTLRFAVGERIN